MAKRVVTLIVTVGLFACGGEGTMRVDSELARSAALSSANQIGSTLQVDTSAGALLLERVRIAVSEVELEGEEEGDAEFEMEGKRIVPVALDGAPTEVAVESVPSGKYVTLGMELTRSTELGSASILVEGTYLDEPFSYASQMRPELEIGLPEPAVLEDGGEARVAVTFDVAAWFLDASGAGLDPQDDANRERIEANIRASMAAIAELEEGEDDDD
jgi:hypothetical protein